MSKTTPEAVRRPWYLGPYHDATIVVSARPGRTEAERVEEHALATIETSASAITRRVHLARGRRLMELGAAI